jgi:hypothetical protein
MPSVSLAAPLIVQFQPKGLFAPGHFLASVSYLEAIDE